MATSGAIGESTTETVVVPSETITFSVVVATVTTGTESVVVEVKTVTETPTESVDYPSAGFGPSTAFGLIPTPSPTLSSIPTTHITSTSLAASSSVSPTLPAAATSAAAAQSRGGLPIAAIIGIVVGVLALVVALVLLRALLHQHRALKSGVGSPHYRDHLIPGFVSANSARPPAKAIAANEKTLAAWIHEMPATEATPPQELLATEMPHELAGPK